MTEFYYGVGAERKGPFKVEELKNHPINPDTLVWREGLPQWVPAASVPELALLFPESAHVPPPPPPPPFAGGPVPAGPGALPGGVTQSDISSKKIVCGVLAIVLGQLGIHKFILGYTGPGVIMLLVTILTCGVGGVITWVIGVIEGIIYLTKTDAEFYETYMAKRKDWF